MPAINMPDGFLACLIRKNNRLYKKAHLDPAFIAVNLVK
jgi:hypothetical protein